MVARVVLSVVVGAAAVLSAVSMDQGAAAEQVGRAAAAASADGMIAYTVVRSAEQLFETSVLAPAARRLRTSDAVEYEPSVSPNGRRLVFVSTLGGSADIYVSSRNGVGQRRLTTSAEADYDPSWSPGGMRLAWVRERSGRGEIWVMAADGSGQRRIVAGKNAQNPSWSPDGRRLVFSDWRNDVVYSVSSKGGGLERLAPGWSPVYSPDGAHIALARDVEGTSTIMLYDVASRSARTLFAEPEEDDSWPAWSPDGKRIAFERYDYETDTTDIWVAGADGKRARPVLATWADEGNPRFTPDGKRLTFTSDRAADADIAVANADGTNERFLVTGPSWDRDPSWSPDGTMLAYTSDGPGNPSVLSRAGAARETGAAAAVNWDIYLVRADGTGLKRLTRSPADDVSPAWGPANRIAFESDRSGDSEIWTMEADGTGAKQVSRHDDWDGDPDWSPDGAQIVYSSDRGGDTEIFVTSVDGRDTIQVTRNDVNDDGPAWSPDGSRIAYASNVADAWSIWVVEPDGSNVRRVTRSPADDEYPDWSADGNWILFSRDTGDLTMRIMRVRPTGGGATQVTTGAIQSGLPSAFAPSS